MNIIEIEFDFDVNDEDIRNFWVDYFVSNINYSDGLNLKCQCGNEVSYRSVAEVPMSDAKCKCGNYFIKYINK